MAARSRIDKVRLESAAKDSHLRLKADEVLRVYVTVLEPEPLLTSEKLLTELVPTGKTGEIVNGNEVLPVGIATLVSNGYGRWKDHSTRCQPSILRSHVAA